jgi:hypothetical protein
MKKRNKKAQFYLIATFIVVLLIVGLSLMSNYSSVKRYSAIENLKEELQIERGYVLDYGIYNEKNMDIVLNNFTEDFAEYVDEDITLYFLYGEEANLTAVKYTGGNPEPVFFEHENGKATIIAGDEEYGFILNKGQNFYYIISRDINGEIYIAKG